MLRIFSRRVGEMLQIGDQLKVTLVDLNADSVVLKLTQSDENQKEISREVVIPIRSLKEGIDLNFSHESELELTELAGR